MIYTDAEPKRWPTASGKFRCVRKYILLSSKPNHDVLKHCTVTSEISDAAKVHCLPKI